MITTPCACSIVGKSRKRERERAHLIDSGRVVSCRTKNMAELSPFSHQVGGHTCILLVDDRTVCKPWRASEVRFYESAPEELRGFIARYNGVMRVRFGAAPDGTLSFTVAEPDGMSRSTVKAETVVGGQREWSVECQAKLRSKFGDDGVMSKREDFGGSLLCSAVIVELDV